MGNQCSSEKLAEAVEKAKKVGDGEMLSKLEAMQQEVSDKLMDEVENATSTVEEAKNLVENKVENVKTAVDGVKETVLKVNDEILDDGIQEINVEKIE